MSKAMRRRGDAPSLEIIPLSEEEKAAFAAADAAEAAAAAAAAEAAAAAGVTPIVSLGTDRSTTRTETIPSPQPVDSEEHYAQRCFEAMTGAPLRHDVLLSVTGKIVCSSPEWL
jgi:hypothetical protein